MTSHAAQWWVDLSAEDAADATAKLNEYGSQDLVSIGQDLSLMMGWQTTPEVAAELGAAFYLRGKVARMVEAYRGKFVPSDDTIKDVVAYGMMIRRIREVGGWK